MLYAKSKEFDSCQTCKQFPYQVNNIERRNNE